MFYSGSGPRDTLLDLLDALTSPPRRIAFEASAAVEDETTFTRLLGEHSARRGEIPLERFRGRVNAEDPATLV